MPLQSRREPNGRGLGNRAGYGQTELPIHRWLHPLAGRDQDIAELRHKLRSVDLRLDDHESQACLCGKRLDAADTAVAESMGRRAGAVAGACRPSLKP